MKLSEQFNGRMMTIALAVALALCLSAGRVLAWDVTAAVDGFDLQFGVDTWSGSFDWITLGERVYAGSGPGFVPLLWETQAWDGVEWPNDTLQASESTTIEASIFHFDTANERFHNAVAFIYSNIAPGVATGVGFGYDFELSLAPFSWATVRLDGGGYIYLDANSIEDDGIAFASLKLYDPTRDVDEFGGVNEPFDSIGASLLSGNDPLDMDNLFLEHLFENDTGDTVVHALRFEGNALVFQNIPEPTAAALFGMAAIGLIARRRSPARRPGTRNGPAVDHRGSRVRQQR